VMNGLVLADARHLPVRDESVQVVLTSSPYWGQRDYEFDEQMGVEDTYQGFIENMMLVAREVHRILKPEGVFWYNCGDTYNTRTVIRPSSHQGGLGHDSENIRLSWSEARDRGLVRYSSRQPGLKDKDLMGIPWRLSEAMVEDGWFLRVDVIWTKPWGAPENAQDRPTRMHEYIFMFSKSPRYFYDKEACPEARTSVWDMAPGSGDGNRAVFPDELVRRCVLSSSRPGDVVYDPFCGSGTTQRVSNGLGRVGLGSDGRLW